MSSKTIFITGGGTGGHIYPAVAVFNALKSEGYRLFYVGNKNRLEYDICKKEGFEFLSTDVEGMPRRVGLKLFFWIFRTIFASFEAFIYFLKYKPDAVFATGGYVSAPTLICANLLKVPYMLHDCDAYPGIVSRKFSKNAKKISVAFEGAKKYFKNKNVEFNGNPIRENFKIKNQESAKNELGVECDKFLILIMGGSQGAKSINGASLDVIRKFENNNDIRIILQTGKKNYDDVIKKIGDIPNNTTIQPYFDDMTTPLIASDLVVSRAGSLSISEICASNSPSILIPYPYAAHDHQRLNAKNQEELGASIYLEDDDCKGDKLFEIINSLLKDKEKLENMKNAAKNNAKLDATDEIKKQLLELIK